MSKCTLFFSRCVCAIALALLSSIFAQASELDSVRTLNLDPNLIWDKISPNDYVLSKDGRTLIKWKNNSVSNLDMEREPRLSKVQFIGDGAFSSYLGSLETVVLASSVKGIGNQAFSSLIHLRKIIIPTSVTSIGDWAFADCSGLIDCTIPPSVTTIGASAFADCSALTELIIPSSVTSIGEQVFSNCSRLTGVVLPSSLTRIERESFLGCYNLKSIVIPPKVVTIREQAFGGHKVLESVIIPSSVTSIGKEVFSTDPFLSDFLNLRFESPKPPYVDDFIASEYSKIRIIVPKGARESYVKANLVANAECVVEE